MNDVSLYFIIFFLLYFIFMTDHSSNEFLRRIRNGWMMPYNDSFIQLSDRFNTINQDDDINEGTYFNV